MSWKQLHKPNTGIPVTPGWCLTYVQDAFGAPWSGATATQGWQLAKKKHKDGKYPKGVAVPVWFSMAGVPAGHVVIRMADGSVYSTSSPTSTRATHHSSMTALKSYYGGRLTLRGWSEDLNGYRVVKEETMTEQDKKDLALGRRARLGKWEAQVNSGKRHAQEVAQLNQAPSWLKKLISLAQAKR
jgi:hypothetical protein